MKLNPVKIICIFLVIVIQAISAHACAVHNGSSLIPFAHGHTSAESKLKLSLPFMISAKLNRKEEFTVSYTSEAKDAAIQLIADIRPGVTIADKKINLLGERGQHTFILQPKVSGFYRLIVLARDLNNKEIPETRQVVYLRIDK